MNDILLQILIWSVRIIYPQLWFEKINVLTMVAQARLETGNYTSKSFTVANNLFGMKKPSKRNNQVAGEYLGHALFKSSWHSVLDYFQWVDYNKKKLQSAPDYHAFLKAANYAEDPNYFSKLTAIEKSVNVVPFEAVIGALCLFFFVCIN